MAAALQFRRPWWRRSAASSRFLEFAGCLQFQSFGDASACNVENEVDVRERRTWIIVEVPQAVLVFPPLRRFFEREAHLLQPRPPMLVFAEQLLRCEEQRFRLFQERGLFRRQIAFAR